MIQVRPKLFDDVAGAVLEDLADPALVSFDQLILIRGVIEVANARGCSRPDDLRYVKGPFSRVRSGDEQAADSIPGALNKSASAERVIARVFFGQRRHDGLDHVVFHRVIGKCMSKVVSITSSALAKIGRGFSRHGSSGEDASIREGRVIKAILRGQPELFLET